MNTEHILIYPHKEYNLHNKFANTLKPNEVVNYGYIKRRNLSKWENDEVVAVKMGMLTPSKKSYFEKTIKDAVVLRIENQDNESCFDDDDELIPVYIFVSTERDDEWRKYLHTRGFNSARKDKKREGILIKKSDIGLHYGKHYNIDTKEVLCEKERIAEEKRKLKEQKEREKRAEEERKRIEKEKKEEEIRKEIERKRELERIKKETYEKTRGKCSYECDLQRQKDREREYKKDETKNNVFLNDTTLEISYTTEYTPFLRTLCFFYLTILSVCITLVGIIVMNSSSTLTDIFYGKCILNFGLILGCADFVFIIIANLCKQDVFSCYEQKIVVYPNGNKIITKTI